MEHVENSSPPTTRLRRAVLDGHATVAGGGGEPAPTTGPDREPQEGQYALSEESDRAKRVRMVAGKVTLEEASEWYLDEDS